MSDAGKVNYDYASQVAKNFQPVHQQGPAAFTTDQLQAQEMIRQLAASGNGESPETKALLSQLVNYTPEKYVAQEISKEDMSKLLSQLSMGGAPPAAVMAAGGGGASAEKMQAIADIIAQNIDRSSIRDATTQMTPDALKEYLAAFDPSFDTAVMDATQNDLERQREIMQQQNASAANKAGAFGGSRHGLVEAETNRGFQDTLARTSADLRLKGLDRAMGAFQTDEQRALQAQLANQGIDWQAASGNAANALEASKANQSTQYNVGATNAQLGTQANIANAQMASQASMANAAAQNAMAQIAYQGQLQAKIAAANLGFEGLKFNTGTENDASKFNIDTTGNSMALKASVLPTSNTIDNDNRTRTTNAINLLGNSGAQQQAFNQLGQDVQYQNDLADQQSPLQKLAILQSALSNTPYDTTTTSSGTSTTTQKQSLFDQIKGLAGIGMQGAALSDERLKRNIKPIRSPLEKLRQMKGVSYNWRDGGTPDLGLVAQDVGKAMPDAVSMHAGAMHYSMPAVLGLLTQSVKELDRRTR